MIHEKSDEIVIQEENKTEDHDHIIVNEFQFVVRDQELEGITAVSISQLSDDDHEADTVLIIIFVSHDKLTNDSMSDV